MMAHRRKNRFFNNADEKRQSIYTPSLTMVVEYYWNAFKKESIDQKWFAPSMPPMPDSLNQNEYTITWIGHSTFLIQANGVTIITDPIFGHLPLFGRLLPPGIALENLPEVDYVLISHNHRDHMDAPSLSFFKKYEHTHFLVPFGDKAWFIRRGFKNVSEYQWWDQKIITNHTLPLTFTFLPAHHWSQRGLFDFNKSLWGSWMISLGNSTIYFAGDTAYDSHFGAIAKEFPLIDVALMPVGPCEPRRWMSYAHVNADEAGQAFLDLKARQFIPMHWGTFSFGTDPHAFPIERIMHWWQAQHFEASRQLHVLKVGERVHLTHEMLSASLASESPYILETRG